jgi:hypothetical protein
VLLLLLGGRLFLGGLIDLHRVWTAKPEILNLDGSFDAQKEMLLRAQVVLSHALAAHRPVAFALHALARLILGLIYLFAVAALFSGDRRAPKASVLAGWAECIVSLVGAAYLSVVVRKELPGLSSTLVQAVTADATRAGRQAPAAELIVDQSRLFLVDLPLLVSGVGIGFGLLLIAYFRSRKVRLFYNQPRQVDHG